MPYVAEDDDEEYDPDASCLYCGGEGYLPGEEFSDPLWYDRNEFYPCPSCRGTGLRKDMTLW